MMEEIKDEEKYDSIENLCGIDSNVFNDFVRNLISTGIRKTNQKLWIIKKHKRTKRILHEHYFDVYKVHPIQNFEIGFIIHHNKENVPQIAFIGIQNHWELHTPIRKGKDGKLFVFTLERKNKAGNYTVIRNYKDYSDYYENIKS